MIESQVYDHVYHVAVILFKLENEDGQLLDKPNIHHCIWYVLVTIPLIVFILTNMSGKRFVGAMDENNA